MNILKKTWFIFIILILAIVSLFATRSYHSQSKIFLYGWQRPEDFSFLNNPKQRVAYYAGSIVIKGGKISTAPRLQPLNINRGNISIPVIRIDDLGDPAQLNDNIATSSAQFIIQICGAAQVGCQIDFDARVSERPFYTNLLKQVRSGLNSKTLLSITALLSWCDSHSWLDNLPISEAIPMFYRIGPETNLVRKGLTGSSFMKNRQCGHSVAISLDEPLPDSRYLKNRDIYIFNPHSWTPADFSGIIKALKSL